MRGLVRPTGSTCSSFAVGLVGSMLLDFGESRVPTDRLIPVAVGLFTPTHQGDNNENLLNRRLRKDGPRKKALH